MLTGVIRAKNKVRKAFRLADDSVSWALTTLAKNSTSPSRAGIARSIGLWRHGFFSEASITYDFDSHDESLFISHRATQRIAKELNGDYDVILSDKLVFHRSLSHFASMLPKLYGVIRSGRYHPEPPWCHGSVGELLDSSEGAGGLVAKPIRGRRGEGILILKPASDGYEINGEVTAIDEIERRLSAADDYIVTELLVQTEYARRIYDRTANTIRVMTLWDPRSGHCFTAAASHRFGTSESGPVDNRGRGGLTAGIDLETGEMGPATSYSRDRVALQWTDHHVDSGAPIRGVRIPNWKDVLAEVEKVANYCPFVPYVGWDIILTDRGVQFIEGNANPGLEAIQMHGPLLQNPRVRKYFKENASWLRL